MRSIKWDDDEEVKSQDISNVFVLALVLFAVGFFIGLIWGISIGMDMEQQRAFGESGKVPIIPITLNDTLGISDRITVNVSTRTGIL